MEGTRDMPATTPEANIMTLLLTLCEKQGLFPAEDGAPDVDEDLIEARRVDSMGLTYLQALIEQEFSVEIPLPMLVSELRSIRSIATYLAERLAASNNTNVKCIANLPKEQCAQSHNGTNKLHSDTNVSKLCSVEETFAEEK